MSAVANLVRPGFYLDSVALMRHALALQGLPGVEDAALMIGTASNLEILSAAGLLAAAGRAAGAEDLVIAVRGRDAEAAEAALEEATRRLVLPADAGAADPAAPAPRGLAGAMRRAPGAGLALISVPGPAAALEAHRALGLGLDVMVFSDNVPLREEVALKARAARLGRIVMGPDCGTALIAGVPLGFVNDLPCGPVGIVAASGSGAQELSVLLAAGGIGVSHIVGVGGRDLDEAVGGTSALAAIELLGRDPGTEIIVLVSKPPAPRVASAVAAALVATGKRALACFVGMRVDARETEIPIFGTLRAAAEHLLGAVLPAPAAPSRIERRPGLAIRGLFAGGTLCAEAQAVLRDAGTEVASNAPIPGAVPLGGPNRPRHRLLDLGADEYTRGRPHPMLEPAARQPALAEALADPSVGVIVLDVVLGFGAHADPAGLLSDVVAAAGPESERPVVIASLCGTTSDRQGRSAQSSRLASAGIRVTTACALASGLAAALVGEDRTD